MKSYVLHILSLVAFIAMALPLALPVHAFPEEHHCTEVIGFSQTKQWYVHGGFESKVDGSKFQLRAASGASIEKWASPTFKGWTSSRLPTSACAAPVDRVILFVSGPDRTPERWRSDIDGAIGQVIAFHGPVDIVVEPVVGGPGHDSCGDVRAARNHPVIDSVITASESGVSPEVQYCLDYSDSIGHLTAPGARWVADVMSEFYKD